jgi:Ala-tRNA(Pro) deacylase
MHAREEDLLRCLDALDILHTTYRHDPVFTVEESRHLHADMPGAHSKNLFLKDKKGVFLLAVVEAERKVDLKALSGSDLVPGGRLSFARADYVRDMLGVEPGSVTPFVMLNETARGVTLILDKALTEANPVNFHPLHNAATTAIAPGDLLRFLDHCGVQPIILDFDAL